MAIRHTMSMYLILYILVNTREPGRASKRASDGAGHLSRRLSTTKHSHSRTGGFVPVQPLGVTCKAEGEAAGLSCINWYPQRNIKFTPMPSVSLPHNGLADAASWVWQRAGNVQGGTTRAACCLLPAEARRARQQIVRPFFQTITILSDPHEAKEVFEHATSALTRSE